MFKKGLQFWPLIVTGLICTIGLLYLAYAGLHVRPGSDDLYYTSHDGSEPYYKFHFLNGRLTSILLYGFFYELPLTLQIIPAIGIILLFTSLFFLVRSITKNVIASNRALRVVSLATSAILTISTCILLPGLYVSLYWFAAAPVHTWSIILSLLYVGLAIHYNSKPKVSITTLLSIFIFGAVIVGCLAEIAAVSLAIIGLILIASTYARRNASSMKIGISLFVSALVSLAILFFSPGAISRRQRVADVNDASTTDLLLQLPHVLWENIFASARLLDNWPIVLLLMIMTTLIVLLTPLSKEIPLRAACKSTALIILAAMLYVIVNVSLIWIGLHEPQPLRSYFSTTIMLIIVSTSLGVLMGLYLKRMNNSRLRQYAPILLIAATITGTLIYAPYLKGFGDEVVGRGAAWDERSKLLNGPVRNSNCTVPIQALPIKGMWVESNSPTYWVNESIALHYKLPCVPYTDTQYIDEYIPIG